MRDGRTTSDLEEDATGIVIEVAGGDAERLRLVVGRPRPFFLKNGTVTLSVSAIVKKEHADGVERRGGSEQRSMRNLTQPSGMTYAVVEGACGLSQRIH